MSPPVSVMAEPRLLVLLRSWMVSPAAAPVPLMSTRTTSTVSDDSTSPGVGSKSYTIEADRLTALRYSNRPLFQGINTVNSSGTANGAIVTVDAEDGLVTSIVVFQETRGAKPTVRREGGRKIVEGAIQSVWNAKGQNLAPQGASRVEISESGAPTVG